MSVVVKIMVPFWGPLNTGCRTILGNQNGTLILATTRGIQLLPNSRAERPVLCLLELLRLGVEDGSSQAPRKSHGL